MVAELVRRFSQASFSFLQEAENVIIDSSNEMHVNYLKPFKKHVYGCATHLPLLPDVIKTANQQQ